MVVFVEVVVVERFVNLFVLRHVIDADDEFKVMVKVDVEGLEEAIDLIGELFIGEGFGLDFDFFS